MATDNNRLTFGAATFEGVVILDLKGALDIYSINKLDTALDLICGQENPRILLTCRNLEYIDRPSMDYLMLKADFVRSEHQGDLAMSSLNPGIIDSKLSHLRERALNHFKKVVEIFRTDQEAITWFQTLPMAGECPLTLKVLKANGIVYLQNSPTEPGLPCRFSELLAGLLSLVPLESVPDWAVPGTGVSLRVLTERGVLIYRTKVSPVSFDLPDGSVEPFDGIAPRLESITLEMPSEPPSGLARGLNRYKIRVMVDYLPYLDYLENPETPMKNAVTRNISPGGMLLECREPLDEGAHLALSFRLGDARVNLCVAKVTRTFTMEREICGAGLSFTAIHPEDRMKIFNHIMGIEARAGSRRGKGKTR